MCFYFVLKLQFPYHCVTIKQAKKDLPNGKISRTQASRNVFVYITYEIVKLAEALKLFGPEFVTTFLNLFGECTWYKHDPLRVAKRRWESTWPLDPKLHEEIAVHDLPRLWSNSIRTASSFLRCLLFTVTSTKCRSILGTCWIVFFPYFLTLPPPTTTSLIKKKKALPLRCVTIRNSSLLYGFDAANRFLDLIIGTERVVLMWNRVNTGKFGHDWWTRRAWWSVSGSMDLARCHIVKKWACDKYWIRETKANFALLKCNFWKPWDLNNESGDILIRNMASVQIDFGVS